MITEVPLQKDLAEKIIIRFDGELPNYCSWEVAKEAARIYCKMKLECFAEGFDLNIEQTKTYWEVVLSELEKK